MKKLIAFILATVMLFVVAACNTNPKDNNTTASTEPLTRDDVIQIAISSHSSWPYRDDWKVWEYIKESSGATVEVTAYPASEAGTKIPLMFASPDTLVDLVSLTGKSVSEKYVKQGGCVALEDVEQYMPNYVAWRESLTEGEHRELISVRKSSDGKIYYAPIAGRENFQNVRAWLYRKDVFQKHGIAVPTTFDELYSVCKELKELYPSSFPFVLRSGLSNISASGASWKEYWTADVYYDYNSGDWNYGPIEDIALDILTWYNKMHKEGLMTPDFHSINGNTWQELITTDRGFITVDYETRIDFFNSLARTKKPDFDFHAMVPPVANKETGTNKLNKYNQDITGYVLCNTGNEGRIANAAKFLDWFYADDTVQLLSWGKEGETYEVVNGKKKYITDENGTQPNTLYGFSTYGTVVRIDPEANAEFNSKDLLETHDMVIEHTLPELSWMECLSYNEEEQMVRENYATSLSSYTKEMLIKFIIGQEPLSNFDKFKETCLNEMHLEDIIGITRSAHERMYGE